MLYPKRYTTTPIVKKQLGNAVLMKIAGEISDEEFNNYCEQITKEAGILNYGKALWGAARNFIPKQGQGFWGNTKNFFNKTNHDYRRINMKPPKSTPTTNMYGVNNSAKSNINLYKAPVAPQAPTSAPHGTPMPTTQIATAPQGTPMLMAQTVPMLQMPPNWTQLGFAGTAGLAGGLMMGNNRQPVAPQVYHY